jgi:hypothetical protein
MTPTVDTVTADRRMPKTRVFVIIWTAGRTSLKLFRGSCQSGRELRYTLEGPKMTIADR